MWVDVFKWAIFGDRLSLDVDKLVLVGNYWNKEIEDFMLSATRKQFPTKKIIIQMIELIMDEI